MEIRKCCTTSPPTLFTQSLRGKVSPAPNSCLRRRRLTQPRLTRPRQRHLPRVEQASCATQNRVGTPKTRLKVLVQGLPAAGGLLSAGRSREAELFDLRWLAASRSF